MAVIVETRERGATESPVNLPSIFPSPSVASVCKLHHCPSTTSATAGALLDPDPSSKNQGSREMRLIPLSAPIGGTVREVAGAAHGRRRASALPRPGVGVSEENEAAPPTG